MKKIILFIFLTLPLFAQSVYDRGNSSTTTLDSAGVFTGLTTDVSSHNGVSVSVLSDDTAVVRIEFGYLVNYAFVLQKYYSFTYYANDTTFSKYVPIEAPYCRVKVTNAIDDSMTVFQLVTLLHKNSYQSMSSGGTVVSELGALNYYGQTDTVTTRTDTVTVSAVDYIEGTITASDSVEICINGTFTAGQTWIITETTAVPLPRWSADVSKKIYIKRYGTVGTPRFYIRLATR